MITIPHLNTDCQEDEGEWVAGNDGVLVYIHRNPEAAEPIATPMADFLATSYRREEAAQVFDLVLAIHGDIFYAWDQMVAILAGGDKLDAILSVLPEWEREQELNFFEDEVIA